MLDQTDFHILRFLRENSRTPFLGIAKKLHVSESTVRKRVARLKAKGIIRAFTVLLDSKFVFESIVAIKCRPKSTAAVVEKVKELNSLMPVFEVTGHFDVFCILDAPSARDLNRLLDRIRSINGVLETESFLIVKKT
ncbi:MAG: Lrp/AsnC family transcriptional regulator [Candidatus Diapherotrites archaeon]|nr:Lrp/AsnC family transcriptional regulator [Candidatus Diapherotrites archaeon]